MAKDDRDYMRDRYRARAKDTRWNDRAGRVEGTWFDPKIGASTISADGFAEPDRRSAFPGQDDQCSCRGEHGLSEWDGPHARSEEHTSELQSLMCISYAVFCLKKKKKDKR